MAKAPINPKTGVTDAQLITKLRSAIRKVSATTWRKQLILSKRYHAINPDTGRPKYHLKCELCSLEMPMGVKVFKTKKDGTPYKKASMPYEADHIKGNPPLQTFDDFPAYLGSLFGGEGRVLCWECHKCVTKKQRGKK